MNTSNRGQHGVRVTGWAAATLLVALSAGVVGPARADGSSGASTSTSAGRMILVLDSSGSMKEPASGGTTKIAAAKRALDKVVSRLPDDAQVGMRVYGAKVYSKNDPGACTDSQLAVGPGAGNRAALKAAIAKYEPYGETPTGYALEQAAKDLGSEGKRSIVLVSDGEATCKPDPCKVAAQLSEQGINLHIDVVGLGVSGEARQQLQCIAQKGNGTYYGVDSASEIVSSLSRVASRAVRPFTLEGRPIKGSLDEENPTTVTQGVWTDTLPPGDTDDNEDTLHYAFTRTMPGSTLHVSAVTMGQPDSWDQIQVVVKSPDGYTCDTGGDLRTVDKTSVVGGEAISQDTVNDRCASSKVLDVEVHREAHWTDKSAPVQILVAEEPPVNDPDSLPKVDTHDLDAQIHTHGKVESVQGGTSFPDATALEGGSYSGTTVPGETSVFKVHLEWGQRLSVRFDFPRQTPALAKLTGNLGPLGTVRLFDPMRGAVDDLIHNSRNTQFATSSQPGSLIAGTYPVAYRNRSIVGSYSSLAGDYYIELAVQADVDHDTYELPYTLHVAVAGQSSGAPTYEQDPDWNVEQALASNGTAAANSTTSTGPDAPSTEVADAGATATRPAGTTGESGGSGKYVVAGVLVLAALGCAGGGVALLRRRRVS